MHGIEILKLAGGVIPDQVDVFDATVSISDHGPPVVSTYQLANTGIGSATGLVDWTWLLYGVVSDYRVKAVLVSGDTPLGSALSAPLNLASTRSWYLSNNTRHTTQSCVLSLQVIRVVDGVTIATVTITITAEVI